MLIVGGISSAITYGTFLLLTDLSVHYATASILAFVAYLASNFTLNRWWAFRSRTHWQPQILKHLTLHLGNQAMILVGLYLLVELLDTWPAVAQLTMQGCAMCINLSLTPKVFGHQS